MKKVLVIDGHPDRESFSRALSAAYRQGLQEARAEAAHLDLGRLDFSPNLQYGYRQRTELEPDLLHAIEQIRWADHLVWVFPVWWYGYPAVMKGFIDRTFLPGITFRPVPGSLAHEKLLTGKSSRVIVTADTPRWYDLLYMNSPVLHQFKRGTLEFCGISPVRVSYIAPIRNSSAAFRQAWLERVQALGARMR
jgi:putative NADPH-quinone reductase